MKKLIFVMASSIVLYSSIYSDDAQYHAKRAGQEAKAATSQAYDNTKAGAEDTWEKTKEMVQGAWEKTKESAKSMWDKLTGYASGHSTSNASHVSTSPAGSTVLENEA
jgi:hypothetical protein